MTSRLASPVHQDAFAGEMLIYCSFLARDFGFPCPVALTRAAWAACVDLTPFALQTTDGAIRRLASILMILRKRADERPGHAPIDFAIELACDAKGEARSVFLHSIHARNQNGRARITIMLAPS